MCVSLAMTHAHKGIDVRYKYLESWLTAVESGLAALANYCMLQSMFVPMRMFLMFMYVVGGDASVVSREMLPVWKKFLLNQFHDVIPGSCIKQVVSDALQIYKGNDKLLSWSQLSQHQTIICQLHRSYHLCMAKSAMKALYNIMHMPISTYTGKTSCRMFPNTCRSQIQGWKCL